jgi:prepilin-type N-terminal cleavage/methylation domain-containing protein
MARLHQRGLTIVELLVVIIVSGLLMATISSFALDYWTNAAVLQNDESTLVTRLNTGDYIRNAIDSASGLINQNDLPDSNTGAPDTSVSGNQYWIPIHAIPRTITMGTPGVITPLIYFNRPSIDTSKNVVLNGTIPYQDDVVLYMDGSTKQLLARVIANTAATNNSALTTCPPASATTLCPNDVIVADNVSGISLRYFSRSGNPVDYTSIVDATTGEYIGPDFPSVEVVELTLKLTQKAQLHGGANTTNQTVIRVALRN